jgi:Tol biopolymer transport system component
MLAGWTADNNIGILLANPVYQAVYTVPASGGKATQVTPKAGDIETYPCYPKWSHDGKMLYLRRGYGEIVSVPAQGGKFTVVQDSVGTALPGMGNAISPDGKTIVFAGGKRGDQPLGVGIWTVPVAGGEAKKITQSPTQDRYPCWSPDGKSVAFLRYTPGADGIPQIFVTSSNGGAVRQITSGSNNVGLGSIDWSPDGKTIAYFSRDYKISLIHAEGGEHKVLLDVGSSNRNWFSDLAWSPDGNELAYTSGDQLMVVSLKSGQTREVQTGVLDKGIQNFYIDWSPDGSKLAFSAGSGGDEELWLMEDFLHLVKK